ncbi:MAG: transglutaminase family protein [Arenicellales bacterium]|nr:transglutaminase family protein [Arenicellales bacterium]
MSTQEQSTRMYLRHGYLSDPGSLAAMYDSVPSDIDGLSAVAKNQIVHYRMLSQWHIPKDRWKTIPMNGSLNATAGEMLKTLHETPLGRLDSSRPVMNRVFGSCAKESILLVSMLKSKGIPARIRFGYLTNLYKGSKVRQFWMNVFKYERGDDEQKRKVFVDFLEKGIKNNRVIEHWIAEYWDANKRHWRVLDVRTDYAGSYGLLVDRHLGPESYQYSWQAWLALKEDGFDPERYDEDPLDGRSHIRQFLLLDFYSLLNHEGAGLYHSKDSRSFIKERRFADLTRNEQGELDRLAHLMARNPTVMDLSSFYEKSTTLKLTSATQDKYSFVHEN